MARLLWILFALILTVSLGGCSGCRRSNDDDGTSPTSRELPKLELRDDTPDLHITWVDAKGDFHVVQRPADVPVEGRDAVRVYVVGREDGTGDLVYVADLRTKLADGTYPVNTLSRSEFEAIAERRRAVTMAAASPSAGRPDAGGAAPPPTTSPAISRLTVIIYGAEWCQACHDAQKYLRRKGIEVVEKDIEEDPNARKEMQAKLARAGISDRGSIPVIDIRGRILQGFSTRDLDKAIAEATKGDEL
jgi:glutaredoxin